MSVYEIEQERKKQEKRDMELAEQKRKEEIATKLLSLNSASDKLTVLQAVRLERPIASDIEKQKVLKRFMNKSLVERDVKSYKL